MEPIERADRALTLSGSALRGRKRKGGLERERERERERPDKRIDSFADFSPDLIPRVFPNQITIKVDFPFEG